MRNLKAKKRTIRQIAKNIETGWFNLTNLDPIVLDTATGIGWDLEVRLHFTLKETNAMVVAKVFSSFLVMMPDSVSVF